LHIFWGRHFYGFKENKNRCVNRGAALAWVLMALEFPLFFYFPSYLKIDFSDIPALFGGIIAGPLAVIIIEMVKNILHFITMTKEGGIGEIANFFTGVGFCLPVVLIMKRNDKKIILGLVAGTVSMTIVANLVNYFVTLPLYMENPPVEVLISTVAAFTLPFNIVKGIIVSIVAFFLYMALRSIINRQKV
jgi:riboflavin transporter FmnP